MGPGRIFQQDQSRLPFIIPNTLVLEKQTSQAS